MFKSVFAAFALIVSLLLPRVVPAAYPERPITITVPFGAGGESDIVARLLANSMSKALGRHVAVQNIAGAAGVTGMNAVVTARPDGYSLGFSPSAPLAIHPHMRKVPYSLEAFSIIGRAFNAPYFLVTQKSSPWNSFDDMAAAMRAEPETCYWASAGVGSLPYMALLKVWNAYGLNPKHMPFTGDSEAFQGMAGNRVQVYATTSGTLATFDVKALAIMADQRDPAHPDVPTFQELGHSLSTSQWGCLFGPAGLSPEVRDTLSQAMEKACADPEFVEAMGKLGLTPAYLNSEDAVAFIGQESASYAALIRELTARSKK